MKKVVDMWIETKEYKSVLFIQYDDTSIEEFDDVIFNEPSYDYKSSDVLEVKTIPYNEVPFRTIAS
jgi:hypothetical protein